MPRFRTRAVDNAGKRVVTISHAQNIGAVRNAIQQRGWTVLSISPVFGDRWRENRLRRLLHPAGILLFKQLGELLRAGVPLSIALYEVRKIAPNGPLHRAWTQIEHSVAGGESLTDAIEACKGLLPRRYIATLAAAQSRGQLATTMLDISNELTWHASMQQRWRQAASYPIFTLLLLLCVSGFLLFRVLPDLQPLLLPVGTDLPWVTRQAIKLSNVLHSVAQLRDFIIWLMAAFFLVACLSHLLWVRLHRMRTLLVRAWLSCSFTQAWVWSFSVAAHARTLHLLLVQNVPLAQAVRMAAPAAGLCGTQSVWEQVALQVEKGRLLADAASEIRAIPPLYVSLLRVGERRGTLAGSLTMASGLFQQRAEYRLQRLDTLIGPVLVLSVGALMVAVIVWILLPAYDAISSYGVIV